MSIRREKAGTKRSRSTSSEEEGGMINELHELFLDELADIYNAEQQLTKALPKLAKVAKSSELRQAFEMHLEETENHIRRLDQVVDSVGGSLKRKKCAAMEGLIEEGEEMMDEKEDSVALDAAIILAAQKVEHYEIASYGGLRAWAELMGHHEAVDLLQETLDEEKAADEKLNQIAESTANVEAERQE